MKSLLILLLGAAASLSAQSLQLYPSYQSIGVAVRDIAGYKTCHIAFRKSAEPEWKAGYDADSVSIAGVGQFRGGVFLLEENTAYTLRITLKNDADSLVLSPVETSTLTAPDFSITGNIKWVAPDGSGSAYTEAAPGNLAALFASGQVGCGTTVLLKDGVYPQNGLQLHIPSDCSEQMPVRLMAAPGAHPVVDGGLSTPLSWTPHPNDPKLFRATIPAAAAHSTICVMDNTALYPYPSVTPELLLGNYNLAALNFGYDGFVRDESSIWIKTEAGINPANTTVTLSQAFRFLTVYGNNHEAWLKVKGIEFRHFGKPVLNGLGSADDAYGAVVFDIRNAHHVWFDSCRFAFNSAPIAFTDQCDNLLVQHCHFRHDAGKWTHAMIKKSHVFVHTLFGTISSSRARGVENAAVFIAECRSGVIRYNTFDGQNSGVESYIDVGLKEEMDVYENVFTDNFDAIECDGQWTNLRVWKNEIIRPMAGISAAPPRIGPRYFYRNLFYGMQGRRNEQDDPYFIECAPVNDHYMGQGIGIKTNSGAPESEDSGNLYFFNNTFHAEDSLGFVVTSWGSEWRKAVFVNNIFAHQHRHPFFFFNLALNPDFQISSTADNYFSYHPAAPIAVIKHIHGQYDCTPVDDVASLESTLQGISGSPNIQISRPLQQNPGFVPGGFALEAGSALIDAGVVLPGFYDFQGLRPDIGAIESDYSSGLKETLHADLPFHVFPNPAGQQLVVEWRETAPPAQYMLWNSTGQAQAPDARTQEGLVLLRLGSLPNGVYFLVVTTANRRYATRFIKSGF